ncbi:MAG: glycosyltransferase family 2 protein [Candidatus Komeilibacteria bacterium]|nr:glycosyltransferase family 2 protein [Candidatus Komeilibacteria bacterium]
MSNKLAISLVTNNAEKYLPFCLTSVFNQTYKDFTLLIIDNGSSDRTVKYLQENYPQLKMVAHQENLGFAQAHNQAISWSESEYLMMLNQDIILEPDYLEQAVKYLDNQPAAAVASGKILIWDFADNQRTKIIDSLGLKVFKNHRVVNIKEGETDLGEDNEIKEIFGVSGAAPIFRRSSLERVKIKLSSFKHEEYLDEDFFSYKEDVDLAWRLRLAGYQAVYLPKCVAYHDRSVRRVKDLSDSAARVYRQEKNKLVKVYSYKNHFLLLFKNEFFKNLIKYFPPLAWYEFKKFAFILLVEPTSWQSFKMIKQQWRKNWLKRKYIIKNIRKITAEELAKWYE